MPFASIYPSCNLKINIWKFGEKILRIGGFEKITFLIPQNPKIPNSKIQNSFFFSFIPVKIHKLWLGWHEQDLILIMITSQELGRDRETLLLKLF